VSCPYNHREARLGHEDTADLEVSVAGQPERALQDGDALLCVYPRSDLAHAEQDHPNDVS
jgi:hypothetical protein